LISESTDRFMITFDQIPAGLDMLIFVEAVPHGPHASADAVSRFQNRDTCSIVVQFNGSRQSCKPCTRNDDRSPA